MAIKYQFMDEKYGLTPGSSAQTINAPQWATGVVYPANAFCTNGGFVFKTTAGGTSAGTIGPTPQVPGDGGVTWVLASSATDPTLNGAILPVCSSEKVPAVEPGYIALAKDPTYGIGEFRYVKFTGATDINAGDCVVIDAQGQTAIQSPASNAGGLNYVCGVSMGTQRVSLATPLYGWVMVRGVHDGANVVTGSAAGKTCAFSALGRVIGGGPVTLTTIDGMIARTVSAGNQGTVELYWPTASGRAAV